MKQKKPMRGIWWILFLLLSVAAIFSVLAELRVTGIEKNIPALIFLILPVGYIAAFFTVPAVIKPKNDTETPAEPIPSHTLSVPSHLTLVRDSSMVAAVMPTLICLNGNQVCSVTNGASETIELTESHNVLTTNFTGSSKTRFEFDAPDGAQGELHLKGGVFLPKTLVWNNTDK